MEKSETMSLEEHVKTRHGGVMPNPPCKWMIEHGHGGKAGAVGVTGASGESGGGATGQSGANLQTTGGVTGAAQPTGMSGNTGAAVASPTGATGATGANLDVTGQTGQQTDQTGGVSGQSGETGATGATGQTGAENADDEPKFSGIKDGKIWKNGVELSKTFQDGGTQSKWRLARNKWVKELIDKEDDTLDLDSGKPISYKDGFQLAFQTTDSEDGGMDDAEYDRLVDEISKATGSKPHLGNFEVPEISFWVKNRLDAIKLMEKYNQHSIWNWKKTRIIMNKNLDTSTNSVKQGATGATGGATEGATGSTGVTGQA